MSKSKLPTRQRISFKRKGDEIRAHVPDLSILLDLFGTDDQHLASGLLLQAAGASGSKDVRTVEQGCEIITAIIEDFAPQDATERLLAVQMAATHTSLMAISTRMNDATTLQGHEVYERSFNRLARTFTAQTEALRKHRNGGQSKVTVEHVTVNAGGQAIVGNVERRSGSGKSKSPQCGEGCNENRH